tara:strand:+ start:1457 stop:2446 length:990 start_codon:yes stop_codon:yes gene_type:complete
MAAALQQVKEATTTQQRALAGVKAQPKDKVTLPVAPWDKKKEDPKKEAADLDKSNADKALKHDCATHVEHADWGKGQPISEQHTIVETAPGVGYVTHYDVMFEHGIEKNVSVKDLDILSEMSHGHSKKKEGMDYNPAKGEYNQPKGKEVGKKVGTREAMDPVDKKGLKGKHADRDDKDIDNDGDADKSDEYLHKKRKAISKNMKEGEVEMSPKKKTKSSADNAGMQENTLPPVYARIMEARGTADKAGKHSKGAADAETMDDKLKGKGAKDMAAQMTAKTDDKITNYDELGHDDAAKAGRAGPTGKMRPSDNKAGDKKAMPSATPMKGM